MQPEMNSRLPNDLEDLALARFDELHHKGRILYEHTHPEHITHNGFRFTFFTCPFLKSKPIKGPDSATRNKAEGPFVNPKPDEVIGQIGLGHRVMLNTYCMFRPMLLVTTMEFEKQSNALNRGDIEALWATMAAMRSPQVAFYNCGVNSGSSQGHKHMQLFPLSHESIAKLYPSEARSTEGKFEVLTIQHMDKRPNKLADITSDIANVPFKHFVLRLPPNVTSSDVFSRYERLLTETQRALKDAGQGTDHNVILTLDWIVLVPRSIMDWEGPWGSNAMGMVGIIAVRDDAEREEWAKRGYTDYLRELGISRDRMEG